MVGVLGWVATLILLASGLAEAASRTVILRLKGYEALSVLGSSDAPLSQPWQSYGVSPLLSVPLPASVGVVNAPASPTGGKRSFAGHGFVELITREPGKLMVVEQAGFWPQKLSLKALFSPVSGRVTTVEPFGNVYLETGLTAAREIEVRKVLAKFVGSQGVAREYSLYERACTQLVGEVARAAGLKVPQASVFNWPAQFLRALQRLNPQKVKGTDLKKIVPDMPDALDRMVRLNQMAALTDLKASTLRRQALRLEDTQIQIHSTQVLLSQKLAQAASKNSIIRNRQTSKNKNELDGDPPPPSDSSASPNIINFCYQDQLKWSCDSAPTLEVEPDCSTVVCFYSSYDPQANLPSRNPAEVQLNTMALRAIPPSGDRVTPVNSASLSSLGQYPVVKARLNLAPLVNNSPSTLSLTLDSGPLKTEHNIQVNLGNKIIGEKVTMSLNLRSVGGRTVRVGGHILSRNLEVAFPIKVNSNNNYDKPQMPALNLFTVPGGGGTNVSITLEVKNTPSADALMFITESGDVYRFHFIYRAFTAEFATVPGEEVLESGRGQKYADQPSEWPIVAPYGYEFVSFAVTTQTDIAGNDRVCDKINMTCTLKADQNNQPVIEFNTKGYVTSDLFNTSEYHALRTQLHIMAQFRLKRTPPTIFAH